MQKVYITKVLKGKEPIHSIGFIDTEAKKLYVPFVSKKGMSIIDTIDIDYLSKTEDNGYHCMQVIVTEDGKHFVNVYYANLLK